MATSDAVDRCGRPIDLEWWNDQVKRRTAGPLDPPALRSLLALFPTGGGDFVLVTTLFRYVKLLNPRCVISVALKPANVPMARCCPLVDHVFPLTPEQLAAHEAHTLAPSLAGQADAVLDLIRDDARELMHDGLTLLQAFWLLAGAPPPPRDAGPIQLTVPPASPASPALPALPTGNPLRPWLGAATTVRRVAGAAVVGGRALADVVRQPRVRNTGLKVAARRSGNLLRSAAATIGVNSNAPNFRGIILSTTSASLKLMPPAFARRLVRLLRDDGWTVFANTADLSNVPDGTLPLMCSHAEFLQLRAAGVPFVGWRSGLCDVAAAASGVPMCVFYPPHSFWSARPIESYGFASMGIRATCMDIEVDKFDDRAAAAMIDFLRAGAVP